MTRRRVALPALLALAAIGIVLVSVSAAHNPKSGAGKHSHRPRALVPTAGAQVPYGASVRGRCLTVNRAAMNEMRGWGVYTFDPGRLPLIGHGGRDLLPTHFGRSAAPPGLDRFASSSTRPRDPTQWQVAGMGRQMPVSLTASCAGSIAAAAPDAVASGTAIVLRRPGPYVYWTFDHTVHWTKVNDGAEGPTPRSCAQDPGQAGRSPAPVGSPPSSGGVNGWHWAVDAFCTTVRWWSFDVLGSPGRCSDSPAGSSYVNQYTAGARLGLPVARGRLGGNACGPSSLLMAMLQSERRRGQSRGTERPTLASLPPLQTVFDRTMRQPRDRIGSNEVEDFVGMKAVTFLGTHGWKQPTLGRLGADSANVAAETTGSDVDRSNEATIDRALRRGPIVLSTDLGRGRWGTTGDGHMIVVTGRARTNRNEYVVYDPAGNYFSDPVNHYGPGSCGGAVLYPRSWVLAYATGSWYIELGPRRT
jgi:hypothetical protein